MSEQFKPGDMVECISLGAYRGEQGEIIPVLGGRYTVRDAGQRDGWDWIRLVEITNVPHWYGGIFEEANFYAGAFRLIKPPARATDISIFRKIDDDVFERVPA